MAVSQYARRIRASAVLLALGLAACSHDEGPSPFNPEGMSADLSGAQTAFDSPITASFEASGAEIAATLGAAAPAVISPASALLRPSTAHRYAQSIARLLPAAETKISASAAAIPSAVLGTTFAWDSETAAYAASDLPGAPAKGVRFLLYAINPVTGQPVEPLQELGYVDVTDVSAGSIIGTRVLVYADGVSYLDYTVSTAGTGTSGTITVKGFASNGSERANYTLQNTIAQSTNGMLLTLDYALSVPSRGLAIGYTATFGNISPEQVAVTLDFSVSGRNGDVTLSGTYGAAGGTFSVKVNGEIFATVTLGAGSDPTITGASGTALAPEEEATLRLILDFYDGSLAVFDNLLAPLN